MTMSGTMPCRRNARLVQIIRTLDPVGPQAHAHSRPIQARRSHPLCHDLIGDPTLADAILDRLVHNAHRLQLAGESMRKRAAKTRTLDHAENL